MEANIAHCDIAVGMAGTFDIENYGDLLFPLIAAAALKRLDPRIRVVPFSVTGKSRSFWPFEVRPLEELSASMADLSAMLIGGGQIVRFDNRYPILVPPNINMPIAYWLVPAIQATLAGKPVIWNAVGAWSNSPRAPWHYEPLRQVFAASYFIGVRDVVSRDLLAKLVPDAKLELLPDTAFGLSRLWPLEEESVEFTNWRRSLGLEGNYIVIQASAAVGSYRAIIESLLEFMGTVSAVILPVCWCHGDRAEKFPEMKGRVFRSREWLPPELITEIIGRSEFVCASSLHACITALSYGVPVARASIFSDRKQELLDAFQGIAHIENKEALRRLIKRGRQIEPRAMECADRLDSYWNKVADVVLQPPVEHCNFARTLMLNWVSTTCDNRGDFGFTRRLAMNMRESLARHFPNKRLALRRHLSFVKNAVVAPFRWTTRNGMPSMNATQPETPLVQTNRNGAGDFEPGAEPVLNLSRIAQQRMEAEPYQWAFIDQLFSQENAALLAASFPRDKFKKVKGYDGEKGYEYMSRSLVYMGASVPSYPEGLSPAWRVLVHDLLSPEYRSALAQITGRDLTSALMEINVIHYGPGAWLGPHLDLKEKMITHVLYFNETWDPRHGGCLNILRSSDPADVLAQIPPVVGNSVLLVRSNQSWHSVSRVAKECQTSRRSVNIIFHLPGSVSTMWPPGDKSVLRNYVPAS